MEPAALNPANICQLPDELSIGIFNFLPVKDVYAASLVCRKWLDLARDNLLWKRIFFRAALIECSQAPSHKWMALHQIFSEKNPQKILSLFENDKHDPYVSKILARPEKSLRMIKALFAEYQLTKPKTIDHPFIEVKEGSLVPFARLLRLENSICYYTDKIGRKFIFMSIKDMYNHESKIISLQQRCSQSGDWYVFCHSQFKAFRFAKREDGYLCCGQLVSEGRIVDRKIYRYLKTLIETKKLKVKLFDENVAYKLE